MSLILLRRSFYGRPELATARRFVHTGCAALRRLAAYIAVYTLRRKPRNILPSMKSVFDSIFCTSVLQLTAYKKHQRFCFTRQVLAQAYLSANTYECRHSVEHNLSSFW